MVTIYTISFNVQLLGILPTNVYHWVHLLSNLYKTLCKWRAESSP